jgi:adenylate cyclase
MPQKSAPRFRLSWLDASGKKQFFQSGAASILIGRRLPAKSDQVGLDDDQVSARHARIIRVKDGVWIEDLSSSNGTWINGKRIAGRTELEPASIIRIGRTILNIEGLPARAPASCPAFDEAAAAAAAPVAALDSEKPLPDLVLDDSSLAAARERLTAICELTSGLSLIDSIESLSHIFLDHLHRAFSRPGRPVRSGLLLGPDLLLKAYRPEDLPPTCSLTLARRVLADKKACLWQLGAPGDLSPSASLVSAGTTAAMYIPLLWGGETLGVVYLDAAGAVSFGGEDLRLAQLMAVQAAMFIRNFQLQQTLQREALIKSRLLAQFPRSIAERIARMPENAAIPSEKVDAVTILMADVRGFTKMSKDMDPEAVVRRLNEMFQALTPIILRNNGTVDKYIGDAVLAVFGSPDPDSSQWEHAAQAAVEMQAALRALETGTWAGFPPFRIGIGLHTGPAIHGFIGAAERMEYTIIGTTINVASRYCDAAGPAEILISPAVYARLHFKLEVEHPPREIETKHEGRMKAYLVRGWKGTGTAAL